MKKRGQILTCRGKGGCALSETGYLVWIGFVNIANGERPCEVKMVGRYGFLRM